MAPPVPLRTLAAMAEGYGVDLYWLPLGAGGHFVRLNGIVFEAVVALLERRRRQDLYHSALEVRVPAGRFVIEQAPVRSSDPPERGVVAEGPIAFREVARFRLFHYENRCWRDGVIPDVDEAVASPQRICDDPFVARRILELVGRIPMLVWGRDELHVGDMWNSNSVIAWLLAMSGVDAEGVHPPAGGCAPGWRAGVVAAGRAPRPSVARYALSVGSAPPGP